MSCSICKKSINADTAPIIAMGGFGHPRCICDECAEKLDIMNNSIDIAEIKSAMNYIAETMANNPTDDMVAHNAVKVILIEAGARIKKLEDGTYVDSENEDEMLDVPEELAETEEDRELDRQDEEKNKKLDTIFNWITIGIIGAAAIGIIIYFILKFFGT